MFLGLGVLLLIGAVVFGSEELQKVALALIGLGLVLTLCVAGGGLLGV